MRPTPDLLAKTAIEASHAAGAVILRHFGKKLKINEKKNAGLVTNADIEAEAAALKILKKRFPDFGVLAEESPPETSRGEGRFIVDPLDGTTNFVHRFPMFCVSLGVEWKGEIVAGVIYHPIFRETYVAIRGKGARKNGKKIHVSRTKKLTDSLLTTGFTYRKAKWLRTEMDAFERLSGIVRAIRRPGSAALDLAYTACGVFDGFWERKLSPWDTAAGSLLVTEAGGKVTDFHGKPFRVDAPEILASNPLLHRSLMQTIEPEFCQLPDRPAV